MYTVNIDEKTGIAYGYISANALDSDLVTELLDEGLNLTAKEAFAEWQAAEIDSRIEEGFTPEDAAEDVEGRECEFWEEYAGAVCEETIEGVKDGVTYCTSWLGGALNFFILESPHVTECACLASPCVPNAGILDTLDGHVQAYNVPDNWRRSDDY